MVALILALYFTQTTAKGSLVARRDYANYRPCPRDLCLVPYATNNTCFNKGNSCVCQSSGFLSDWASCVGTLCPDDIADVLSTAGSKCKNNGDYELPITPEEWESAAKLPWKSAVGGVFTTAPPSPTAAIDPIQFLSYGYPSCVVNNCVPMAVYYFPICNFTSDISRLNQCTCQSPDSLALAAACVGKLCPSDFIDTYSALIKDCYNHGGWRVAFTLEQWGFASLKDPLAVYERIKSRPVILATTSTTSTLPRSLAGSPSATVVASPSTYSTTSIPPPIVTPLPPVAPKSSISAVGGTGLTLGDKIALGVGLGIGLPTVILALIQLCIWIQILPRTDAALPHRENGNRVGQQGLEEPRGR